jgi:hypothetical protein
MIFTPFDAQLMFVQTWLKELLNICTSLLFNNDIKKIVEFRNSFLLFNLSIAVFQSKIIIKLNHIFQVEGLTNSNLR